MKKQHLFLSPLLLALALPGLAAAQDHSGHAGHAPAAALADAQPLSEGEVVRWDASTQKITLRHGELKNLGMPPMTMVFRLQNPPALPLGPGAKVRFVAERQKGVFVVTHMEAAP